MKHRITTLPARLLALAALLAGNLNNVLCCTTGWTNIGSPPWEVLCAIEDPLTGGELVGSFRSVQYPNGGGVYAHSGNNLEWVYRGLAGQRVYKLSHYPYCRSTVFASTDQGLFASTSDTLWTQIASNNGSPFEHIDFIISPWDTSVWLAVLYNNGEGRIRISRNSGQSWSTFYNGTVSGNLIWSRTDPSVFYFSEDIRLTSLRVSDSTAAETVIEFGMGGIRNFIYHPTEDALYIADLHSLARVDLVPGHSTIVPAPSGVSYLTSVGYSHSEGLFVGSSNGLHFVTDSMDTWIVQEDSNFVGTVELEYVGDEKCIAATATGFFATQVGTFITSNPLAPPTFEFSVSPNPTKSLLHITLPLPSRFQLYNVLGRLVFTSPTLHSGRSTLDIGQLPSGAYFGKLLPGNTSFFPPPQAIRITVAK